MEKSQESTEHRETEIVIDATRLLFRQAFVTFQLIPSIFYICKTMGGFFGKRMMAGPTSEQASKANHEYRNNTSSNSRMSLG